ncbi:hypothetical protein CCP3SC1_1510006 [Gammaproteobacteria bacterium]
MNDSIVTPLRENSKFNLMERSNLTLASILVSEHCPYQFKSAFMRISALYPRSDLTIVTNDRLNIHKSSE